MKNTLRLALLILVIVGVYSISPTRYQFLGPVSNPTEEPSLVSFVIKSNRIQPTKEPETDTFLNQAISMTLEEKVRQLLVCGYEGTSVQNALNLSNVCGNFYLLASNISGLSDDQIKANNDSIHSNDPQTWIMVDQEGGRVARINDASPSARIMGDSNAASYWGDLHGKLLKSLSIDVNLAPVADITTQSPVIGDRSFADSPDFVSKYVDQYLQSLQANGIIAVVKHLPGHGRVLSDTHYNFGTLNYSWSEISSFDLVPFASAINSGAEIVMVGHIIVPELDSKPATISQQTISKLRETLPKGTEIILITDSLSMKGVGLSVDEASIEALRAGEDLLIIPGYSALGTFVKILDSYNSGYLDINQLNQSVVRILKLKAQFGK